MKWNPQQWLSPRVMIRSNFILVISFILLAVASLYGWGWLSVLDREIGLDIIEDQNDFLTPIFIAVTELGGTYVAVILLTIVSIYVFKWQGRPDLAVWFILTVSLGAGALNQFFKFLFERPRPPIQHLVEQGGYSFPSGHSMGATILYGSIVFLLVQLGKKRWMKWLALFLAATMIVIIGISRIYLGVHYPSDVIGGFSLGAAWLAACIGAYGLWKERQKKEAND
ncbi:phosphatase PAP2 family protein [Jeotgalibaca caeni]|uniref:phosphatase PAP2 family protein n=1 Tax=Jeotgalibaca caeni TaxID=3028623 RepID=UPI00237E14DA|nr:phosphatase PAP2 family protein [Jeotgalibaca caeni]MDE1549028.1 phosphatase PAP2 family protein [Jeotgalibaca caeni]